MPRNYLPPDEPDDPDEYQGYYPVEPRRQPMDGLYVAAIVGAISAILVMLSFFASCWFIFECPSPIQASDKPRVIKVIPEQIR